MSQPSICGFCRENIVRARVSWDFHHPSYSSLTSSAHRRCVFCTLLHEDVSKHRSALEDFCVKDKSSDQALKLWLHGDVQNNTKLPLGHLYRWSVRSLGRTRESKLMISVTFRVVPRALGIANNTTSELDLQTFDLPERVFYCFPEEELGALLNPADLGASTNPVANDGHQIKSWIRKCGIEHKHCPKRAGAGTKFVPTRLLHIGGKRRGDPILVVDTEANKVKGPYVTLSHCWGLSKKPRLDTLRLSTQEKFMSEGVPWSDLSKNFQQAIEVARFLEVDYIWIDSLCIIQGDANDWKHEGALMHKVYRYSFCNIAAADAADSTTGLFRERRPHHVLPARFDADGSSPIFGRKTWRVVREDVWEHGLLSRSLYTRGWVFQERMLAPRILHFSKHQLFWDCAEMSACETLPAGLPLPLDKMASTDRHWRGRLQEAGASRSILISAANDDSPEIFWKMAVENYTSLDLTDQSDKRLAVWGIAKLVRDSLEEEYVAGLWELALEEQLAWQVAECFTAKRPKDLKNNPSWSWASVKGRILIQERPQYDDRVYRVTDHIGQPLSAKIGDNNTRPMLPRKPSETAEEELAAMGRDLELVDERRRKSSATSRHNSQAGLLTSRHNSQTGFRDTDSGQSTPFGSSTMSPQPTSLDFEAEKQNQGRVTRQNSQISVANKRDMEPELLDMRIAMQGYIHQGLLRWNNEIGGWIVDLVGAANFNCTDITIDAFPDVKADTHDEPTYFVILALSQHFERHESILSLDEPSPTQRSWYTGHGIMLRPLEGRGCYERTGALKVRHLSTQMWQYLQTASEGNSIISQDVKDTAGEKFFLL
ncbi:heterokaryon incompatibility protein-domain-containing protein [Pyrenochaeta sp. MPI-SDFR-AT-0127]|nr:heterokaryon incompatibility protein-domain-containing protein [Pyrenochaeta sp. MPI-SDFR-AT-0127]